MSNHEEMVAFGNNQSNSLINQTFQSNQQQENKQSETDFDPYDKEYGSIDGIGRLGASVHIVRSTIGIGILLMPYLMKNLGYITGILLMLSLSFIYYHTVHILLSVEYEMCRILQVHRLSFTAVAEKVLNRAPHPIDKAKSIILALIYLYYGIPVGNMTFLIVIATNIQQMAKYFDLQLQPAYIMTLLIVPFTLCCLHKKILKILVPYSSLTNICTFVMIGIVICFSFVQSNKTANPKLFGDIYFIPQGLATFILAVRCTGIIIPLKNNMECPRKLSTFTGSLNISGLIIALLYTSFGLIPYLNLGDSVEENILWNIPANNKMSFIIYLLFTLSLMVGYLLAFFVRFQTVWTGTLEEKLEKKNKNKTLIEFSIRIGINAGAYLMAVACPQLALITAVSGTAGIVVEIALPSLLQLLMTSFITKRRSFWLIIKNTLILGISVIVFCMSVLRCVKEIKKLYS